VGLGAGDGDGGRRERAGRSPQVWTHSRKRFWEAWRAETVERG
jgi:hypothetical protein